MSSIFVKHFELPCVERCYINKLALRCLALPYWKESPDIKSDVISGFTLTTITAVKMH